VAIGPHRYALRDGAAPVGRADEGIFGSYAAEIGPGRWLTCPPESCPALNLHGPSAQVSPADRIHLGVSSSRDSGMNGPCAVSMDFSSASA
jgi:hypothetical protein